MSKAAAAFRTISEVADELEVPKHVLRFWEARFPQLRPMKRGGGRRYYRPEDLDLLRGIRHLLHMQGYTIKGVQKILREHGIDHVKGCWRGSDEMAGERPRPGRAVAEAAPRLTPARGAGRAARQATYAEHVALPAAGRAAPRTGLSPEHRRVLESILRELEGCRTLLAGASAVGAVGRRSTAEPAAGVRRSAARRGPAR